MVVAQWYGSMWLNQAAEVLEEHEEDGSAPWSGWVGYLGKQVVTHTPSQEGIGVRVSWYVGKRVSW